MGFFSFLKYTLTIFAAHLVTSCGAPFANHSSTGWKVGGFDSRQGQDFFFPTASTPPLGPTEPPIEWVPGAISPGLKRQGA
jgi:hypothetical protein